MKPEEALSQIAYLRELVDRTRVQAAQGYPYFFLWGILWISGYLGTQWGPSPVKEWLWPAIYMTGGIASGLIGALTGKGETGTPALLKQLGWMSVALLAGGIAMIAILFPSPSAHQLNAFYPFLIGLIYVANGIFIGRELTLIGLWLIIAAAISILFTLPAQAIWLAAAGGGGLLLTGAFLRRQVGQR